MWPSLCEIAGVRGGGGESRATGRTQQYFAGGSVLGGTSFRNVSREKHSPSHGVEEGASTRPEQQRYGCQLLLRLGLVRILRQALVWGKTVKVYSVRT